MTLKPGVRVVGIKPEILLALTITDGVYRDLKLRCEVKSIVDGNHDGGPYHTSSHYSGTSFDVTIPPVETFQAGNTTPEELLAELKARLGTEFFTSMNQAASHIHISYMPQQP